jgi:hypothetical protein
LLEGKIKICGRLQMGICGQVGIESYIEGRVREFADRFVGVCSVTGKRVVYEVVADKIESFLRTALREAAAKAVREYNAEVFPEGSEYERRKQALSKYADGGEGENRMKKLEQCKVAISAHGKATIAIIEFAETIMTEQEIEGILESHNGIEQLFCAANEKLIQLYRDNKEAKHD